MADDGDYPLSVPIRNVFKNENKINILVEHCHYPYFNRITNNRRYKLKSYQYIVEPGRTLCFPLYWRNESLKITFKRPDSKKNDKHKYKYYFWCDPQALYRVEFKKDNDTIEKLPEPLTYMEEKYKTSGKGKFAPKKGIKWFDYYKYRYFRGGIWVFESPDTPVESLTLKVHKWLHDPEDSPITIGEPPPT